MQTDKKSPSPFFGYLERITVKLDNVITKKDGTKVPSPKVVLELVDDVREHFHFDFPLFDDKNKVRTDVFGLLNSLASVTEFGYLKLFIFPQISTKDGKKRFNLGVRNFNSSVAPGGWNPLNPQWEKYVPANGADKALDVTRCSWKFSMDQIEPITKVIDYNGKQMTVDNTEEHKNFVLKVIEGINIILEVQRLNYKYNDTGKNVAVPGTPLAAPDQYGNFENDTDGTEDEEHAASYAGSGQPATYKPVGNVGGNGFSDDLPF